MLFRAFGGSSARGNRSKMEKLQIGELRRQPCFRIRLFVQPNERTVPFRGKQFDSLPFPQRKMCREKGLESRLQSERLQTVRL